MSERARVKVKAFVSTPTLPNYLSIVSGHDGLIDIADIDNKTLRAIGQQWTNALLKHAEDRRNRRIKSRIEEAKSKGKS